MALSDSARGSPEVFGVSETVPLSDHVLLTRTFFPSKIGGSPAWLVPEFDSLSAPLECLPCSSARVQPLTFIMQINANVASDEDFNFHRSIMLFGCASCSKTFKAIRSNLPRENKYYAPDDLLPQVYNGELDLSAELIEGLLQDKELEGKVCHMCGIPGQLQRVSVSDGPVTSPGAVRCVQLLQGGEVSEGTALLVHERCRIALEYQSLNVMLPESELVDYLRKELVLNNGHVFDDNSTQVTPMRSGINSEAVEGVAEQELIDKLTDPAFTELTEEDVEQLDQQLAEDSDREELNATEENYDLVSSLRTSYGDHVVVYYNMGGRKPYWYAEKNIPRIGQRTTHMNKKYDFEVGWGSVPPCSCGSPRVFELQVLSGLLAIEDCDQFNFGSLYVFSCAESCGGEGKGKTEDGFYSEEYVFVQLDESLVHKKLR